MVLAPAGIFAAAASETLSMRLPRITIDLIAAGLVRLAVDEHAGADDRDRGGGVVWEKAWTTRVKAVIRMSSGRMSTSSGGHDTS